jgi:hypothetical protein
MSERHSRAQLNRRLTEKQKRFIKEHARLGNGTEAARRAGYSTSSDEVTRQQAAENLTKPHIIAALEREREIVQRETDYSSGRVRARLDALSHGAEQAEQYGVAVRAEELLGKAAGMFVDQSISLHANLSGEHLQALVEVARQRQAQPLDLGNQVQRKRLLDE